MTTSPATPTSRARLTRWAAPGVALVAALGVGGALSARPAGAAPNLPERSAEQLVADVAGAHVDGLSGTVSETAQLGLPDVSGLGRQGGDWQKLLSGTNTARVWAAGDSARVSLQDGTDETSVYRTGDRGWVWSSSTQTATRFDARHHDQRADTPMTPQEAAQRLLTDTRQDSTVSVSRGATVAGRAAYQLVVTPKQTDTLVDRVEVAVDGETKVPLRFQVFAKGMTEPSAQLGFTDVRFAVPDASVFAFTPPPGATVKQAPDRQSDRKADDKAGKKADRKA